MAGLSAFIERLQRIAASDVLQRVGSKLADVTHEQAVLGFAEQRDPYGKAWAPRKDKSGSWPILDKTGAGVDGMTARYVAGRVVLRIAGYFRFHQGGTAVMVARKVFPEPARGLGTWSEPINTAARDAVTALVRA
jgi:hypothetical protein